MTSGEVKVAEWNEGKRMKWFEKAEIENLIEEGKINRDDLS